MSSYPLRLPLELDLAARTQAKALGISLNAFICVATDAYLKKDAFLVVPGVQAPLPEAPVVPPAVVAPVPKRKPAKPKTVLTAPRLPPAVVKPSPPVLSAKRTKSERQALTKWYRDNNPR